MGLFTCCQVCGVERLAMFKVCWNCGAREDKPMVCNPCNQVPCPHCDLEHWQPRDCGHCAAIHYGTQHARVQVNTEPEPDTLCEDVLHGLPVGAVGRCQHCGGRTYQTVTGEWCPRAFCASAP